MPVPATLGKDEHLKSRKLIDQLFNSGSAFSEPPIKLIYLPSEHLQDVPVCIGVTVPKKNFARAVDRNRLKRRMREAYRKNKGPLFESITPGNKFAFMLVYQSKKELSYQEIELRIMAILDRFIHKHATDRANS